VAFIEREVVVIVAQAEGGDALLHRSNPTARTRHGGASRLNMRVIRVRV
jgi:hypothetical protein